MNSDVNERGRHLRRDPTSFRALTSSNMVPAGDVLFIKTDNQSTRRAPLLVAHSSDSESMAARGGDISSP